MTSGSKKTVISIGLLLALILAPFISSQIFWRLQGPNSRCIVNMAFLQKSVVDHANVEGLKAGDAISIDDLIAAERISKAPDCPEGGSYTFLGKVPDNNSVYVHCDQEGHVLKRKHRPSAVE